MGRIGIQGTFDLKIEDSFDNFYTLTVMYLDVVKKFLCNEI